MTDDPYEWETKAAQSEHNAVRLLGVVRSIADVAEDQIESMSDTRLVHQDRAAAAEQERDRMRERYANEYRRHLDTLDGLSKNLTHAIGHLRAGRKKEALALVEQAARTINNQITPF